MKSKEKLLSIQRSPKIPITTVLTPFYSNPYLDPNNLRKVSDDKKSIIELEIDLIGILTAKLLDNGIFPESFSTCYISPKMSLNDVKEKICR